MSEMELPQIADGEDKSSPFKNRIRKSYRHIRKWAKRTNTNCFRIYDREIPNYQLAIDFYDGRFCVQYFSKYRDEPDPTEELFNEVQDALIQIFAISEDQIYWRNRIRRRKTEQYEKRDEAHEFFSVLEYGVKFRINLVDYLDTGLFLDHRETRRIVSDYCTGKKVLNLFSYTCSFSVHAAMKGSLFTKSVDMSNTYTAWGRENFLLNGLSLEKNEIVREDCLKFLLAEVQKGKKYDVIIIDPPTISRSKKMEQLFDIQQDYIFLLQQAEKLLSPTGMIFFSTNSRRFKIDESLFPKLSFEEISHKTLPLDFHDPKIHRCWKIIGI